MLLAEAAAAVALANINQRMNHGKRETERQKVGAPARAIHFCEMVTEMRFYKIEVFVFASYRRKVPAPVGFKYVLDRQTQTCPHSII